MITLILLQRAFCATANRRYHEIKAELALSGIVPSMMSDANQEAAI